jgi:hypothetical protein
MELRAAMVMSAKPAARRVQLPLTTELLPQGQQFKVI